MAPNFKMVDGVKTPLTPAEQAEFDARQQAWTDAAPQRAAREQRNKDFADDPDRRDLQDKLANATNAQIDQWVEANATNLAGTRKVLKIILRLLANTTPSM